MRVVRGSLSDVEDDRRITRELVERTERTGERTIRVWTPPRQVAFGRRDATSDGYQRARRIASTSGYEPIDRSVGGSAVAYTGSTIAFAVCVPTDHDRCSIEHRYQDATERLLDAFESIGAAVARGEPPESFCPGDYSLQADGKVAGIAQRVKRQSALVGGCIIALKTDERSISRVLEPVYDALEIPFAATSVGSLERAGGPADTDTISRAIEQTFIDDSDSDPVFVHVEDVLHEEDDSM